MMEIREQAQRTKSMHTLALAILVMTGLMLCHSPWVLAEKPPNPAPGARVRATRIVPYSSVAAPRRLTGTLVELTPESITLETDSAKPPVVLQREDITKLELSVAPGRRGRGVLIGLGVGAASGALIGFASGDDDVDDAFFYMTAGEKAGAAALILGSIGALVGVIIAPGEQWDPLPWDGVDIGLGRGPRQAGTVVLTLAF